MSTAAEMVLLIRAVVFTGHNITFSGAKEIRHKFGARLLYVLCTCMSLSDACAHHAMLLWTISMSKSRRGCDLDVCVACLVLSAKMHEINTCIKLSKFAMACRRIFESREATARALEWTLQQNTGLLDSQVHHLTCIMRLFESIELTREVEDISTMHLKHAEIYLLFTSFHGQWYRYLIELYEYLFEKTKHIPSDKRMDVVLCICGVDHVLTL
jgi:hypothetical protein